MKIETVKTVSQNILRSVTISVIALLSVSVVFASCDKDEDDSETLLTLDGSPIFDLPIYAMVGDTIEMHASGVYTPKSTYEWSYEGLDTLYESDDMLTLKVIAPDSLATYSVTLTADCGDEYYSSSLTQFITT